MRFSTETDRVEAFSDGVLAVIITIMVLELRAPQVTELRSLLPAASCAVHGLSEMPVQSLCLHRGRPQLRRNPAHRNGPNWRDLPSQETIDPKCPDLNAIETWMLHRRREVLTRQDCSAAAVPIKQSLAAVGFCVMLRSGQRLQCMGDYLVIGCCGMADEFAQNAAVVEQRILRGGRGGLRQLRGQVRR